MERDAASNHNWDKTLNRADGSLPCFTISRPVRVRIEVFSHFLRLLRHPDEEMSAAPTGGTVVTLSSSNTAVAQPSAPSVTVPAGSTSATFTVTAGTVTSISTATLTATTGSVSATASLSVDPQPVTPTVVAKSPVTTGASGLTASVTARTGMTYTWTISGGTITSAGGAAGVTSGGTNTITYTAGAVGTVLFTCFETNGAGASSTPGSASVSVIAAPATPVITAASPVPPNATGLTAYVTASAGTTYVWTISGGTITSAGGTAGVTSGGTNTITYTAGAVGSITLTCTATNAAGTSSAPGTATVAISAPTGVAHLFFMAHQDDDAFFFDPDIMASVQSGIPTAVVWVTAGSSPDPSWTVRETQARNYLAYLANAPANWSCATRPLLARASTPVSSPPTRPSWNSTYVSSTARSVRSGRLTRAHPSS